MIKNALSCFGRKRIFLGNRSNPIEKQFSAIAPMFLKEVAGLFYFFFSSLKHLRQAGLLKFVLFSFPHEIQNFSL